MQLYYFYEIYEVGNCNIDFFIIANSEISQICKSQNETKILSKSYENIQIEREKLWNWTKLDESRVLNHKISIVIV